MRKVKAGEEEVEFLEEKDLESLFETLLQAAGRRGVSEKVINKAKKSLLKQTKKAEKTINKGKEKTINKGKPNPDKLRRLRESTKRLEDIVKDPSSYSREVIEEVLKSF